MARKATSKSIPIADAVVAPRSERPATVQPTVPPRRTDYSWEAAHGNGDDATEQLLTFTIGSDEYGISILRVREIAEYRPLTPVPMRPRWMRGVMNLRGTVVPVVDLAARLGLEETSVTRLTCLIIVDLNLEHDSGTDATVVAVMVDAVKRVVDIQVDSIQPAPAFGMAFDIVPGLVRIDGELVVLLDLSAIVSGDDLTVAAQMLPSMRESAGVA